MSVSVDEVAIIGTTTQDLADIGAAYYEIVDDLGVLDYGWLPVESDGSYVAYLTAGLLDGVEGDPLLLLYYPLVDDSTMPVQVDFMVGGTDSVSATFTRMLARGNLAELRTFITLMEETGQVTAAQLAQLRARLAVLEAAEAAAALAVATEAEAVTAFGGPAAFSRLIGMGTGRQAALDRAAPITLAEIQAARITLRVARYWRNFYQNAVNAGRGADTSPARLQLFERIITLLGG